MPTIRLMNIVLMLALAMGLSGAQAQTTPKPSPPPAKPAECRAILVETMPGSKVYARRFQDWITRFHAYLVKTGVPAANITVLSGDKDFKSPIVTGPATMESLCKAIAETGKLCGEKDQFALVIIGHGSTVDKLPSLLLPGPDMTPEDLAKAMAAVTAGSQVILNFSGSSGNFLKALVAKGRVNIAATSPEEQVESILAEFFLKALETGAADGEGVSGNAKDGQVTLLEAFNWSSYQAAMFISRQKSVDNSGGWEIAGKESAALFKKLYIGSTNSNEEGSRLLIETNDTSAADAVVAIVAPTDPGLAKTWGGKRLVDEHATLEDLGQENGVSPLTIKGYSPVIPANAEAVGALAAKTVLGRCRPLEK